MHGGRSSHQEPAARRTARVAPANVKDDQRRHNAVAARRAATALQVRGRPRMMVWGDGKKVNWTPIKAVIRRYPDGREEILVPQNLATEQIQYEFPPRSRFLKRLATSKAEQLRMDMLKHSPPAAPHPTQAQDPSPSPITTTPPASTPQPDRVALDEWFSRKESRDTKDRTIFDWMTAVEQPADTPSMSPTRSPTTPIPSVILASPYSYPAGNPRHDSRRIANASVDTSPAPILVVPEDGSRRHYVPLRLLQSRRTTTEATSHASSPQTPPTRTHRHETPIESNRRLTQLEELWRQERERRIEAEEQAGRMVTRLSRLQRDLEAERASREKLQTSLDALSQKLSTFKSSASQDTRERAATRQRLQKQLDRALDELASLKRARIGSRTSKK